MEEISKITGDYATLKDLENGTVKSVDLNNHTIQKSCATSIIGNLENCAICLDDLKKGEIGFFDSDPHIFHLVCIKTWLSDKDRKSCPECRESMELRDINEAKSLKDLSSNEQKRYYCTKDNCNLRGDEQKINKVLTVATQCPYINLIPSTEEILQKNKGRCISVGTMIKVLAKELANNDSRIYRFDALERPLQKKLYLNITDVCCGTQPRLFYQIVIKTDSILLDDVDNIMFNLQIEMGKSRQENNKDNCIYFENYNKFKGCFMKKKHLYQEEDTTTKKEELFSKNSETGNWEKYNTIHTSSSLKSTYVTY
jgi:hypothetical protein